MTELLGYLATRWLAASVGLGLLTVGIDAMLLSASDSNLSAGQLIDDGSTVGGLLAVSIEWLLISWAALSDDQWRRRVTVANAAVAGILAVLYAALRVDVLLVSSEVFSPGAIRLGTLIAALSVLGSTLASALIVRVD
jgi:hypothetical protein